ncbi:MAG: ABC transporter permease [Gemmatimonadota bacterium]|nr:MAG: ABC transporter permease [Gemmatimonadota bacterium]
MRDWKRYVRENLALPALGDGDDEAIVEELAGQLEDLYREAIGRGASDQEAEAYACDHVGDWESVTEYVATSKTGVESSATRWLEDRERQAMAEGGGWAVVAGIERDFRSSARALRKSPGFAAIALATLGLGIGAVTTILSLINGLLLKPLPYANGDELVVLWEKLASFENASVSYPNFLDWRERNRVFEDLAAYNEGSVNLTGVGDPVELDVARISASLFSILRSRPLLGRGFLAEEDQVDGQKVVVLAHGSWRDRFGADPDVVGETITLDGIPATIVGVMPPDFVFPPREGRADMYAPIGLFAENWIDNRGNHPGITVIGRRNQGITLEQAHADMDRIARELETEYPETNTGSRVHVVSLRDRMVRDLRDPMLVLLLAVALLFIIACANVANLVLARGTARQREIAIRTSLGASGLRVVRLLLSESMILWMTGGLLGIAVAHYAIRGLVPLRADVISPIFQIGIDWRVVLMTLLVALLTGLAFGLLPALRSIRPNLLEYLKEGSRSAGGLSRNRLRGALVTGEVGLAVALLVAAGLTARSLGTMIRANPGFDPQNVLSVELNLPESRYPEDRERTAFFFELLDRVRALPGVVSAATTYVVPVGPGGWQSAFHVEGEPPEQNGVYTFAEVSSVSEDYFATMGIPRMAGREFTRQDDDSAPPVVIVDETVAQRYWPGGNAVGKRLKFGDYASTSAWRDVVGVVGHVKVNGVMEEALPQLYIPHAQDNDDGYYLVVKTAGVPTQLTESIRRAVTEIDPLQPIASVTTLEEYIGLSTQDSEFLTLLLGIFAAAALLLAAVGIYGVMAQITAERTHEIGVRMALGSTTGGILGLVLRQSMSRVAIGVVFGLFLAAAGGQLMASSLFGVSALDPLTFVATPAFLSLVALVASVIPARRAARVDPVRALQTE